MDEQRMTKADMAREWIAKEIRIGNFARGSVLPPERELAVQRRTCSDHDPAGGENAADSA